jgi:2-polyprenyl-3-methyl-5-hydroxy-6-metoxy-1,4-benzoquinol methylase
MLAKEHYDNHLSHIYSWMQGDFSEQVAEQKRIFGMFDLVPSPGTVAIDLGAGTGIQSVALASSGFDVISVDFSAELLRELDANRKGYPIRTCCNDILTFLSGNGDQADLIVCMGDTLTHLPTLSAVQEMVSLSRTRLRSGGAVLFSFRDLTVELHGADRFIPVRADESRILTCFLDYRSTCVIVYDILHEKKDGRWIQKISSYPKLRISARMLEEMLEQNNFRIIDTKLEKGMSYCFASAD